MQTEIQTHRQTESDRHTGGASREEGKLSDNTASKWEIVLIGYKKRVWGQRDIKEDGEPQGGRERQRRRRRGRGAMD